MTTKYTDEQISNLLKEVEVSFAQSLKKSEESPVDEKDEKEVEGSKEDEQEDKAEDEAKESSEDKEAAPESKDDSKEDSKEEPKDDSKEEPKDEQDFDYDDQDLEELHKMYSSMGAKEKDAHHNALKKALGLEDKTAEMPDMAKSEELVKKEELYKSEITSLQTKNAELQKNMEAVTKFLETLKTSVPQRKSITSIDYIQKSEDSKEISSEQVDVILQKKVRDSSLSKSDRDSINTYYLNGKSIETIKHLLK